ncbi:cysteine hydrolase [Camelimonas fluminis]|uniref:Cysteine hydrolase family protein n=1 Tax=Camelimonas fluminis TaxID=1576911 RepID=A0ABV7UFK0_9HYPH|nr:isochorismatase family cysteine hydrolase [Camelimonas fluminis]GHE66944.1 cysteine hydrolase [Camelimonas fluminis]
MEQTGLKFGPLAPESVHVCVDMQTLFSAGYPWALPWFERILPGVEELSGRCPERTIFTRFIPARRPGEGRGAWARYYQRWAAVTLEETGAEAIDLTPALRRFAPPARVVDKHVYSPWLEGGLDVLLRDSGGDTLIISGGETDICVMATVIGAIDRGYRVVLVADGVCSFSDETHDAMLRMFARRFSEQLEVCLIADVLAAWRR